MYAITVDSWAKNNIGDLVARRMEAMEAM